MKTKRLVYCKCWGGFAHVNGFNSAFATRREKCEYYDASVNPKRPCQLGPRLDGKIFRDTKCTGVEGKFVADE